MAKRVVFVDDVTGKEIEDGAGGTVRFSLQDEWYELDISNETLAKMEKALKPYLDVAVSVGPPEPEPVSRGRVRSATTTRTQLPGKGRDYLDSVRKWARENGHTVADRGRIAMSIQDAYEAAMKK